MNALEVHPHWRKQQDFIFLLWLNITPVCVCVYVSHFLYSSIAGHLGYFHILVILSNAAMILGVYTPFQVSFFHFF